MQQNGEQMIIAVASGKGGTGKTTVAVNLALSLSNVQVLDCDVEEPNSHIFLNPVIEEIKPACTLVPRVNYDLCDYCILVTEPTPFGLYDLRLAVEVLRVLKIPFGMVINRAGIGDRKVYEYCEKEGIPILLEIPHDTRIARYYSEGVPFVKAMPEWKEQFAGIIDKVLL